MISHVQMVCAIALCGNRSILRIPAGVGVMRMAAGATGMFLLLMVENDGMDDVESLGKLLAQVVGTVDEWFFR